MSKKLKPPKIKGVLKPYKYRVPPVKPLKADPDRNVGATDEESLTGYVLGEPANQPEERFARALRKNPRVKNFQFQVSFPVSGSLPGDRRIDFLMDTGMLYPVDIEATAAHQPPSKVAEDQLRETLLNQFFQLTGIQPLQRLPGFVLETQTDANLLANEMFMGSK